MSNRRRNSSRSRRSQSSGSFSAVLILLGIVIGLLTATVGYLFFTRDPEAPKSKPESLYAKKTEKLEKLEKTAKKGKEKESRQHFEFYTLLPGMEVEPMATKTQAPLQPQPSPSQHSSSQQSRYPSSTQTQNQTQTGPSLSSEQSRHQPQQSSQPSHPQSSQNKMMPEKLRENRTKPNAVSSQALDNTLHVASDPGQNANAPNMATVNASNTPNAANRSNAVNAIKTAQYIIQAGIFEELDQADELKAKLALQGFNTRIQKVQTPEGNAWFRVTLGPFSTEQNALQQKKRLADNQVQGRLILQKAHN